MLKIQYYTTLVYALLLASCAHGNEETGKAAHLGERQRAVVAPPDWTVTRKEFREPLTEELTRKFYEVVDHRLICESQAEVVKQGEPIRLLVGVVNVSGVGRHVLSPFVDDEFPRNVRIAVFDEMNQFVALLPRQLEEREIASQSSYELHKGEMRGKFVDLPNSAEAEKEDPFYISLKPGRYKFQLVACARFLVGDMVKPDTNWEIGLELEAARSMAATVRVIERASAELPKKATSLQTNGIESDWPQLLAVIDSKDIVTDQTRKTPNSREVSLTLTNMSKSQFIGAIDPFLWVMGQDKPPIIWKIREFGKPDKNPHKDIIGHNWGWLRSDFIILPPQGVASCPVCRFGIKPGRVEVSVDIKGGIVIDPEKLDFLITGDPQIGSRMGGVDVRTIHPDSILSRKFVMD